MEQNSVMMEILKQYQKRYGVLSEIYRLTEELADSLSQNDRVSTQLILKMRQDEMNKADRYSADLAILEDSLSLGERQRLRMLLKDEEGASQAETWEEKKLTEIQSSIRSVLRKSVEIDQRISYKIAGKDSYYKTGR